MFYLVLVTSIKLFYYGVLEDENSGDLLMYALQKVTYKDQKLTRLPFPLRNTRCNYITFERMAEPHLIRVNGMMAIVILVFTIKLDDNNMWNG